jgi:hypothetical protein
VQCDVRDHAAVAALVAQVAAEHGRLDILVCVAGVGIEDGSVDGLSEDTLEGLVSVNLKGPIRFARACIPRMRANAPAAGGSIVNVSSQLALAARPGMPAYIVATLLRREAHRPYMYRYRCLGATDWNSPTAASTRHCAPLRPPEGRLSRCMVPLALTHTVRVCVCVCVDDRARVTAGHERWCERLQPRAGNRSRDGERPCQQRVPWGDRHSDGSFEGWLDGNSGSG